MLNSDEIKRYNRHIQLTEIGMEGQLKLKNANVLVIGAGGLGCAVLQYLTAVGVGKIGILEFDKVHASNLQRQVLYSVEDVGKPKVDCAIAKLTKQNPFVEFIAHPEMLRKNNAQQILHQHDIIIDCTDNYETRYLINDVCVALNKPFIYGAIYKFEGQVAVFNYKDAEGNLTGTYRCLFPEPAVKPLDTNCSEVGVVGVLPGVIGVLQANEAIKLITGIGTVLANKLVLINLLTMETNTISFERNND